ncbi:MAG: type II toxin-antitoxin system RelE/ParE family toxin [Methylocystis sp.]
MDLRCRNLGETPGLGVARSDVRPDLRMFPVGNYLNLYRPIEAGAEIVRVFHDAR